MRTINRSEKQCAKHLSEMEIFQQLIWRFTFNRCLGSETARGNYLITREQSDNGLAFCYGYCCSTNAHRRFAVLGSPGSAPGAPSGKLANVLVIAAVSNGIAQLFWFWHKAIHQIDVDGMDYSGIALALKHGLFDSAISGFRSPLISWLIALIPGLNVFASGKLITICAVF